MESGWRLPALRSVGDNTSPGLRAAGPSETQAYACLCPRVSVSVHTHVCTCAHMCGVCTHVWYMYTHVWCTHTVWCMCTCVWCVCTRVVHVCAHVWCVCTRVWRVHTCAVCMHVQCVYTCVVHVTHSSSRTYVSVCMHTPAHVPSAWLVRALCVCFVRVENSKTEQAKVPALKGLMF